MSFPVCSVCKQPADVRVRQTVEALSDEGHRFLGSIPEHDRHRQTIDMCLLCGVTATRAAYARAEEQPLGMPN